MSTSFLILLTLIPRGTPALLLPLDGLLLLRQLENDFLPRLNNYVGVRPVVDEVGEKLDRFSFKERSELLIREVTRVLALGSQVLNPLYHVLAEQLVFYILQLEFVILYDYLRLLEMQIGVLLTVVQVHGLRFLHYLLFPEVGLLFL